MYFAGFELESMDVIPVKCRCALVIALVDALAGVNLQYLRFMAAHRRQLPPMYTTGVRWQNQVMGNDKWRDIPRLLVTGKGSCEDLAAWRAAELRLFGEAAKIDVETYELGNGSIIYHVTVERPDGSKEDPSAALGMKDPRRGIR